MITLDAPVPPSEFTGRNQAVQKVRDQLLSPELLSAALVGGPRTGKTSLLRYLASSYSDALFTPALKYRAYIDAQLLSAKARPADFWTYCCRALLETVTDEPAAAPLRKCLDTGAREIDLWDLTKVFDAFGKAGTSAVLFVDSWDLILKNQNYWGDLFHTVRALGQRFPRGVSFVVGAQRPLLELWVDQMGSIYYNTFANVMMGTLDVPEIRQQVAVMLAAEGIAPDPATISAAQDIVVQASDNHPWLVCFVTSIVAAELKSGRAIDRNEIGAALRDGQGKVVGLVRDIRAALTPSERFWLDNLSSAPQMVTSVQRALLARLRDYGLLPPGTRLS